MITNSLLASAPLFCRLLDALYGSYSALRPTHASVHQRFTHELLPTKTWLTDLAVGVAQQPRGQHHAVRVLYAAQHMGHTLCEPALDTSHR